MRHIVLGSVTVKVLEASMDMLTPPCSPNSWWALANAVAGSFSVAIEGNVDFFATKTAPRQSHRPRYLFSYRRKHGHDSGWHWFQSETEGSISLISLFCSDSFFFLDPGSFPSPKALKRIASSLILKPPRRDTSCISSRPSSMRIFRRLASRRAFYNQGYYNLTGRFLELMATTPS
ncbi:hypothetical protein V6N11_033444 [Hibiscus sabdariffa]|uniref:Uncharacterized protein n=1 Tax=Hibiscus sabdariffa TaxID=183260 RepID=A0ABR2PY38_9ROSI